MKENCMKFCKEHDKTWQIIELDFLQCYIGYIVNIQDNLVQIKEFISGNSLIGIQGQIHVMPIEYLPAHISIKHDCFNRFVFRFQQGDINLYYFMTPTAVKTAHLRLGMPRYPSLDGAAITASMIGTQRHSICRVVCQKFSSKVYLIKALFGRNHYEYPWTSWTFLLHNQESYEILKWDYQYNIGLSIIMRISDISFNIRHPKLPIFPFYGAWLDGTGHTADRAIAGFYLPGLPNTAFIIAEAIFKNFSCQDNLSMIYQYSRCQLDAEIEKYAHVLEDNLKCRLTEHEYLQYCNNMVYKPKIDKIFSKRDYKYIKEHLLHLQKPYTKLSLELQCMRAIHGGDEQLQQRFFYNGKNLLDRMLNMV